jgi:NAD(P)-dependent dehydrogenase (short-subunit alcohol dehydrogenase family)
MVESSLNGRKILVTGGTRGIGRAIAECFRDDGGEVTVTGTKPDGNPPAGCSYRAIDFTDRDATQEFAKTIGEMAPDILINNAGINKLSPFIELPLEDFEEIQAVNLLAPFLLCQAVLASMSEKGWGRIVNISSIWGKVSKKYRAPYSASKFALDGMSVALAAEFSEQGVMINCVAPGFTDTELTQQTLGPEGIETLKKLVPVRRLGSVEEIAGAVRWLAGPENTYITGQNIAVDGGFTRV